MACFLASRGRGASCEYAGAIAVGHCLKETAFPVSSEMTASQKGFHLDSGIRRSLAKSESFDVLTRRLPECL